MVWKFIKKYKEDVKQSISDLKHLKTFYKQIPNLLTFLRLVGAIPAGLVYYFNPYLSIGLIAFLWGTDLIDGKLAKKFHIQSKLGADMDAFADKIMFLASSLPLMTFSPLLIINFILEGVISLINVTGRIRGLDTKTVMSGKVKTVSLALTLVSGYFVQFFGMNIMFLNILMNLTTGLQFIAIKDYVVEFIRMDKELKFQNISNYQVENNSVNLLEQNDYEKEEVLENTKISLDELRKEKEFYSEMSEFEPIKNNIRSRKI